MGIGESRAGFVRSLVRFALTTGVARDFATSCFTVAAQFLCRGCRRTVGCRDACIRGNLRTGAAELFCGARQSVCVNAIVADSTSSAGQRFNGNGAR